MHSSFLHICSIFLKSKRDLTRKLMYNMDYVLIWIWSLEGNAKISVNVTKLFQLHRLSSSLVIPSSFFLLKCLAFFFQCHLFFNLWAIYFPIKVKHKEWLSLYLRDVKYWSIGTNMQVPSLEDWDSHLYFPFWDRFFIVDKWFENQMAILFKEETKAELAAWFKSTLHKDMCK